MLLAEGAPRLSRPAFPRTSAGGSSSSANRRSPRCARCRRGQIGVRRVVLGADAEPIAKAINLKADEVVINAEWEKGQLTSVQAAIRSLPPGTDGILLCLIDHPLISATLVQELVEHFYKSGKPIVLPVYEGRRGHPLIFAASLYDELLRAPLETGARAVVWAHSREVEEVQTSEEGCILNLNDPETMHKAFGGAD